MDDLGSPDEQHPRPMLAVWFFKRGRYKTCIVFFLCIGILFGSLVSSAASGRAESAPVVNFETALPSGMFFVGERLEYEVSYSIFSLGTVKVEILDTAQRNGATVFRAKALMDSYSGVPFVNLHWMFFSEIDPHIYSRFFSGVDNKDSNNVTYSNYSFDYVHDRVFVERGIRQQRDSARKSTDTISSTYQDGLSLFYYARGNVHSMEPENIPTFVDEKKVNTYINFTNKKTSSEIDAVKYPVETIEFDGRADFVGIFGLTGGFSGWFSNDEAAVPIVAKMKVILGSIRLELVKWNRPGWVPPRAHED
jgi:Protein of unknown function (DUF3108)